MHVLECGRMRACLKKSHPSTGRKRKPRTGTMEPSFKPTTSELRTHATQTALPWTHHGIINKVEGLGCKFPDGCWSDIHLSWTNKKKKWLHWQNPDPNQIAALWELLPHRLKADRLIPRKDDKRYVYLLYPWWWKCFGMHAYIRYTSWSRGIAQLAHWAFSVCDAWKSQYNTLDSFDICQLAPICSWSSPAAWRCSGRWFLPTVPPPPNPSASLPLLPAKPSSPVTGCRCNGFSSCWGNSEGLRHMLCVQQRTDAWTRAHRVNCAATEAAVVHLTGLQIALLQLNVSCLYVVHSYIL